jgi:hypothetical protein
VHHVESRQCTRHLGVDLRLSERRRKSTLWIDRHSLEPHEMRRPGQDGDVVRASRGCLVSVRSHVAREHQPRVWRNERANLAFGRFRRSRDVFVDFARQRTSGPRVPRASHGCGSDAHRGISHAPGTDPKVLPNGGQDNA